jgi:hypothetical protein
MDHGIEEAFASALGVLAITRILFLANTLWFAFWGLRCLQFFEM